MQLIDELAQTGAVQLVGIVIQLVMSIVFFVFMLYFDLLLGILIGLIGLACLIVAKILANRRTEHNHKLLREQV